jgi:ribonuclease I
MNVCHSTVAKDTRHALENSKEFRQCAAQVFSRVSRESVQKWADAHNGQGYFEPLALTCQWALDENLVGLTPTLVWEETSTGEIGIYEYPV